MFCPYYVYQKSIELTIKSTLLLIADKSIPFEAFNHIEGKSFTNKVQVGVIFDEKYFYMLVGECLKKSQLDSTTCGRDKRFLKFLLTIVNSSLSLY